MYTDAALIAGCRKKKLKYQEALYRQFYGFAMSVCLRYAPDREDALEILNDSFLKVFDHIDRYDDSRPFKTWFRRILVNTALDHWRSNRRYRLFIELADEHTDEVGYEDTHIRLQVEDILSLFSKLPEVQRLVFNLHKVEGYNHEEIGGLLDIAPGTSRSHLSRAVKKLQGLLQAQPKENQHEAL